MPFNNVTEQQLHQNMSSVKSSISVPKMTSDFSGAVSASFWDTLPISISNEQKWCPRCRRILLRNQFWKQIGHRDGLRSWCKDCLKQVNERSWWRNREKLLPVMRTYGRKHRDKIVQRNRRWQQEHPWLHHLYNAIFRCENPNGAGYKVYGGRGIRCFLSKTDIKFLWDQDKASSMKQPSLDRIDRDGHYILSNCRFIEMRENFRGKDHRPRRKCHALTP